MFFLISSIKLGWFRWNFIHSFLNKFAAKSCTRFPHHLNNVPTLPCETWNAHRALATTAMSEKVTLKFIPPQLWLPDLNSVTYSMWKYCERRCKKHAALIWIYWRRYWRMASTVTTCCSWATPFSVAVSVPPESRSVMSILTPVAIILHTLINWIQIWRIWRPQLRWNKLWSLLLLTTQWQHVRDELNKVV